MAELGPSPLVTGDELPVEHARAVIAQHLRPLAGDETVPVDRAVGRVLAADLVSPIDVPAHDNSAMDGYAFAGADLASAPRTRLQPVEGTVFAGAAFGGAVGRGQCVRIMTGAVMPPGLDTVVPVELMKLEGGHVEFASNAVKPGENRRKRGEDLARGQPALAAGRVLRPADLGLAASLGLDRIEVKRRLRVAVFSTGDEVQAPGTPLAPGCIYDSNRFGLIGALQRLGVDVLDLGLVRDDPLALAAAVDRAVAEADAVLTSGGVSMGDADYTKDVLEARGEVGFWKVAMRPGRPFAFGPLRGAGGKSALLFALPGNPVAALVTYYVFVRDALLALAGAQAQPVPSLRVRSAAAIRKRPGRSEYQRGIVERAADGQWEVRLTGAQGAGILRSLSVANALVVLGPGQGSVAAGDLVEVWLFDGLT